MFFAKALTKWFSHFLEVFESRTEINSNPHKNSFSIKQIFIDNWNDFLKLPDVIKNGIRPVVLSEVERMMKCYDFDNGFALFECPHCLCFTRVPFTCKSRFCNKCGIIYARNRTSSILKKTLDVKHRHVVFTIDKDLRYYFKKDRKLLGCLFKAVEATLFSSLRQCGRKKENLTPGFIMVLHTFGRDLKWNPHIHVLLTEGGMTEFGTFRSVDYINYERLRKAFMKVLFDELSGHIHVFRTKQEFYRIKRNSYMNHKNGFYVYAPKLRGDSIRKQKGQKQVIEYVLRYAGRPVMAQSRIEAYDKETKTIMYWYEPHESNETVHVTENVLVFIGKLIQHIPEKHFKTLRYAGVYAAKDHKYRDKVKRYKQQKVFQEFIHRFRNTIIQDFKRDPLICTCGTVMELVEVFTPG